MAATNNTVKTFSSKRSATIAVNKAQKAYDAAKAVKHDDMGRPVYPAEADTMAAWNFLQAVKDNARAQGFYGYQAR